MAQTKIRKEQLNDLPIAQITGLQTALDSKTNAISPITPATKTKVTYNDAGLITSGADAVIADISGLQAALDAKYNTSNPAGYQNASQVNSAITAATVGFLDDRGNYDASSNLFPSTGGSGSSGAIVKGDLWTISVAGTLGGSSVTPGDVIRALTDTPGQTASNWAIAETNIGYTAENQANKSTNSALGTSNTLYPTQGAVKLYVDNATGDTVVTGKLLTGFTVSASYSSIVATDTVLDSFEKIQKGLDDLFSRALPSGGATGKVLKKQSATNYDTIWSDAIAIGDSIGSSTVGSILVVGAGDVLSQDSNFVWDATDQTLRIVANAQPALEIYDASLNLAATISSNGSYDTPGVVTAGSIVGNGIYVLAPNPSYSTVFEAGTQTATIVYTLPTAQGGTNTFLKNDGTGVLSWDTLTATFNITGLPATTPDIVDEIPFADVSDSGNNKKTTVEELFKQYNKLMPRYGYRFYTDFIQELSATATDSALAETNSGAGAATTTQATDNSGRAGLVRSATGTTATGRAAVASSLSAIRLGGGSWFYEALVNVTTLSTSTERFQLIVGFIDTVSAINQADAVAFLYDEGGVSTGSTAATYWQTLTANNSTRTFNTSLTQTTVSAGTWVRLGIEVNAAGNSVGFYINGSLVSTHSANIPTTAGRELGFGWLMIKSVGTASRTVDFDYVNIVGEFTSAR